MICNVFRQKRRLNGKTIIGRLYRGRFRLAGESRMTTISLHTTDKQVAMQKLLVASRERERELAGLADRKQIGRAHV